MLNVKLPNRRRSRAEHTQAVRAGKNKFDRADWNGPQHSNNAEIKPTECLIGQNDKA